MDQRYSRARKAFEYLETLAELSDQVELDAKRLWLMQQPTHQRAASMYESGIDSWFAEHGDKFDSDDRVAEIRETFL